jgi:hypothetical protein
MDAGTGMFHSLGSNAHQLAFGNEDQSSPHSAGFGDDGDAFMDDDDDEENMDDDELTEDGLRA